MNTIGDMKSKKLEQGVEEKLKSASVSFGADDDLFVFAPYDPSGAEKTGYSNYSYWGCTFRAFLKRKTALILLIVLVLLVAFTFIQPYLPGQYDAVRINNYPASRLHLTHISPTLDNIYTTVPEGTALRYIEFESSSEYPAEMADNWIAVSGQLDNISRQKNITILEYGEEWCLAEYNGVVGYVKNNFQTSFKVKIDKQKYEINEYEGRENTPYECYSNKTVTLYAAPVDISNPNPNSEGWLYTEKSGVVLGENGIATASADISLRIYPSVHGFLFGTNERGQDLWARVWSGTRTSLYIGFMVAIVEALVGIIVGVIWGYVKQLDRLLTELYNVLDNIPTTIVLILIAYVMSPSVSTIIFAMCLTRWMGMARFIRNQIIIIRDRDYNVASRCLGATPVQIMSKNLLPYLVSVIMLRMALAIPGAIGSEVFITYIGLGIPVTVPSLGNLINVGRQQFAAPSLRYQLLFPTIVLSIITISFYIIGNAFADAADPRNHL